MPPVPDFRCQADGLCCIVVADSCRAHPAAVNCRASSAIVTAFDPSPPAQIDMACCCIAAGRAGAVR